MAIKRDVWIRELPYWPRSDTIHPRTITILCDINEINAQSKASRSHPKSKHALTRLSKLLQN